MIVDFHSHHFPVALAERALRTLMRRTGDSLQPSADGTLENHLDHLAAAGVDKAVMCPVATKPSQHDVILRTALAMRDGAFGERARTHIVPFASVHPADPDVMRHIREIARAGIRGVKIHPYYQNFDLADPAVRPMFEALADHALVVQCHCGQDIGYPGRTDACRPREIERLLKNVRRLTFVAAHLGGCRGLAPHATDALLSCGCYLDTAVLHRDWSFDEQVRLLRTWPADRLLFGTDFPWVHYPEALRWVRAWRAAADLPAILGGNAARLLRLTEG